MLNIPDEIKALYKTDSVRKNFRVHFPNGENPDLTNSDIVAGSVSFTESVCSKDVLQFGLAEASRIEFECVNVPNIYGAVIECYNEIDATDADAQYQTTMPDLDYPVYQIPLGVFTVSSCPRSAGAMWKRRVEAYSEKYKSGQNIINDFLNEGSLKSEIYVNPVALGIASLGSAPAGSVTQDYAISFSTAQYYGLGTSAWEYNGNWYQIAITAGTAYIATVPTSLSRITCTYTDTVFSSLFTALSDYGAPDKCYQQLRDAILPNLYLQISSGRAPHWYAFDNPEDTGFIYNLDLQTTAEIRIPINLTAELVIDNVTAETYTFQNLSDNVAGNSYSLTSTALNKLAMLAKPTSGSVVYRYTDIVDLDSLQESVLELFGAFGQNGRNGNIESISLSKSSPVSMSMDEYSSLWWDEYDISPIGSVQLTYKDIDLNEDQTIIYEFGTGLSTYDMTNNYLLKNLAVSVNNLTGQTVEEFVTGLLDTYFIPNIQDIAFTPVQLSSLGLPYLEAGDYLEIDDGNGGTVGTYIMSRTLSGVQFLEDDIESKGGEIIGNVRSA